MSSKNAVVKLHSFSCKLTSNLFFQISGEKQKFMKAQNRTVVHINMNKAGGKWFPDCLKPLFPWHFQSSLQQNPSAKPQFCSFFCAACAKEICFSISCITSYLKFEWNFTCPSCISHFFQLLYFISLGKSATKLQLS